MFLSSQLTVIYWSMMAPLLNGSPELFIGQFPYWKMGFANLICALLLRQLIDTRDAQNLSQLIQTHLVLVFKFSDMSFERQKR